jgi:hypothetical protein
LGAISPSDAARLRLVKSIGTPFVALGFESLGLRPFCIAARRARVAAAVAFNANERHFVHTFSRSAV